MIIDKGSNSSKAIHVNPNLLDNWYFGNPVNQKRKTTYGPSIAYGIDRWKNLSTTQVSVNDGNVSFANANLAQIIESDMSKRIAGMTVTLSALTAEGEFQSGTFTALTLDGAERSTTPVMFSNGAYIDMYYGPALGQYLLIRIESPGKALNLVAIKLELGSEQTLCHREGSTWVLNEILDYADQLAKCQRYQIELSNLGDPIYASLGYAIAYATGSAFCNIPTPVTMRGRPSIEFTGNYFLAFNDYEWQKGKQVNNIRLSHVSNNLICVYVDAADLTVGQSYILCTVDIPYSLLLDANL